MKKLKNIVPQDVDIIVVSWNHRQDLIGLLDSLKQQKNVRWRLFLVDNASDDHGPEAVLEHHPETTLIRNTVNVGFARAANQGIDAGSAPWVFLANPDLRLQNDFLCRLIEGLERFNGDFGCGKLYRFPEGQRDILDSAGMIMTPEYRHFDRGSQVEDGGQFDRPARVFGATGAAALYRRNVLERVRVRGTIFDERFFAYREDADLSWRLRLAGYECLYIPDAVGWHRRKVTPDRRRSLPEDLNRHSVRNRFLMRWNNGNIQTFLQTGFRGVFRDFLVFFACLHGRAVQFSGVWGITSNGG